MNQLLRRDAEFIVRSAIETVSPNGAVKKALTGMDFPGQVFLVAVGKAGWRMAHAALEALTVPLSGGVVVTKYGHVEGPLKGITCYEGGHPLPDEGGIQGTRAALDLTSGLGPSDTVLFLLSGGSSALFEQPLIPLSQLQDITDQLLASGAAIDEINSIRKRLSGVKGGRFAQHCAPAQVVSIVLSDVLGDRLDTIGSGPAYPDGTTCLQVQSIVKKYSLRLSDAEQTLLRQETPKVLDNVRTCIIGSVGALCDRAAQECSRLGYRPILLTDCLCCEAKEAGSFLSSVAATHAKRGEKLAFLAGGETIVHLGKSNGLGGRNQELALAAAKGIAGLKNTCVISVGSDGTDGPTDAAGGYVDGDTWGALQEAGLDYDAVLANHDAYHALKRVDGLIVTGPTGTNVNDIAIALIND